MPSAPPSATRQQTISLMDVIVGVELFILALVYSRTYTFFPTLRSPLNWAAFMIPLAFVLPAFILRLQSALITIGIVIILFAYQLWFASLWHTPFTGTALGSYQGLLLTAMIAMHARRGDPSRFLTIFFVAALCYLALYLYLCASINPEAIRIAQMQGSGDFASSIRRTHDSREGYIVESEYKVGTSGAIMSFLVLYSLGWSLTARGIVTKMTAITALALSCYAIWIADSRWNLLSTLIACVVLLIPFGARLRSLVAVAVAAAGIAIYTVAAFTSFNIFSFIAKDVTGAARVSEFYAANPVLLRMPVSGIGIKNSADDYDTVFQGDVFTSDLGWYGDLIQTGVIGMLVLLFCHWVIARFAARLSRTPGEIAAANIVSAYLIYLACVQFITPQLWGGAGSILLCWSLAYVGVPYFRPTSQRSEGDPV
jgi:hypothetical protein